MQGVFRPEVCVFSSSTQTDSSWLRRAPLSPANVWCPRRGWASVDRKQLRHLQPPPHPCTSEQMCPAASVPTGWCHLPLDSKQLCADLESTGRPPVTQGLREPVPARPPPPGGQAPLDSTHLTWATGGDRQDCVCCLPNDTRRGGLGREFSCCGSLADTESSQPYQLPMDWTRVS